MVVLAGAELIFLTVAGRRLFWICAEYSVDITIKFSFIVEQMLLRAFSAGQTATLAEKLGLLGRLGGETARTYEPN